MAVPTLVGASTAAAGNSPASLTVGLPAGAQADDVLVTYTYRRQAGTAPLTTSSISDSWNDVVLNEGTTGGVYVWWKRYDGNSAYTGSTITYPASSDTTIAQMCAIRGADYVTFVDQVGAFVSAGSTQFISVVGMTPTVDDAGVFVCGAKQDNWSGVATLSGDGYTWTEVGEPDSTLGGDAGIVWDFATLAGAPVAVSAKQFTVSGGAAAPNMGGMFSIRPASAMVATDRTGRQTFARQAVTRASAL